MGLQTVEALCTYAALLESEKDHLVTAVILYFWRRLCTMVALFASQRCLHEYFEYFEYLEYFEYFGLEFLQVPKNCSAGLKGW